MRSSKRAVRIVTALFLLFILAAALFFVLDGPSALHHTINRWRVQRRLSGSEIQAAFAQMEEKNPEAESFFEGYQGVTQFDLTLDLTDELTAGKVPYLVQWDARWGYCQYGTGLMGWTGCGPTALSMVAMAVTGDGTLTPAYIAFFAINEGYCVPGNGTSWTLFSEGAQKLGLLAKELPLWEANMRAELGLGRPIICIMGPGHFTDTGHYIVLTECTEEGFMVYDPYRPSNCRVWSYDELQGEIRNLWSYFPYPSSDPAQATHPTGNTDPNSGPMPPTVTGSGTIPPTNPE